MGGKLSVVRAVLLTTTYCHGLCSERAHNKSKDIALEAVLAGGRSRLPVLTSEDRAAALGQLIASAKVRKALSGATGQVSQAESAQPRRSLRLMWSALPLAWVWDRGPQQLRITITTGTASGPLMLDFASRLGSGPVAVVRCVHSEQLLLGQPQD